jgi:AcrR family transcriptional regulator
MEAAAEQRSTRLPFAARREQLLDHAEELFMTKGFAATSIEDVARASGVSRPIVYEHFGSKEGVYLACVERARANYERELLAAIDPSAEPREQIRRGAEVFFSMLQRDPGRWRLLFATSTTLPGEDSDRFQQLRFRTIAAILPLLQRGAPETPPARIEAWGHAIAGIGERFGFWWLAQPDMTLDEVVEHYLAVIFDGIPSS